MGGVVGGLDVVRASSPPCSSALSPWGLPRLFWRCAPLAAGSRVAVLGFSIRLWLLSPPLSVASCSRSPSLSVASRSFLLRWRHPGGVVELWWVVEVLGVCEHPCGGLVHAWHREQAGGRELDCLREHGIQRIPAGLTGEGDCEGVE